MFEDKNDYMAEEHHEEQDTEYIGLVAVGVSFIVAFCITLANI